MTTPQQIEDIYKAQNIYFKNRDLDQVGRRIEILKRLQSVLFQFEEKLEHAIHLDFGKSPFETFTTELLLVHQEINYFIKNLKKLSKPQKVRTNLSNLPGKSRIVHEPLGICLIIGSWNYPIQVLLMPAIAAIAAGNSVILKPSEYAPHTANTLADMMHQNFDLGRIAVLQGGAEVVKEIFQHKLDHVFFTGSTQVGNIIYSLAAQQLTPVTLELGGKSPVIVTESANLKVAARRIIWGKFLNAGQTCIAPDHLYVQESIRNELIIELINQLKALKYLPDSDHYTKIINHRHWKRLQNLIESKANEGNAQILTKGEVLADENQLYIAPTLIMLQNEDHALMKEEIFGPILPILSFENFSELMTNLREKEKSLAAYLFSTSKKEIDLFITKFSYGGGCINDVLMHITNANLPFGGIGSSGIGNYHGRYSWKTFTHTKSILQKPNWGELLLKYPPYSPTTFKLLKKYWKYL